MNKISILIVNFNSSDFIKISLYALSKLTKNPYKVFVFDNGSSVSDFQKLKKICSNYQNVFLERKETNLRGSVAHGSALDHLVSKVDTPYFSVLDADAIWLAKNWDEILIQRINGKVKTIGTQWPGNKPKDFPGIYAILFETSAFKKLNISFKPRDINKLEDTGFELREKYFKAGYKGEILEERNTRYYKKGPFKEVICTEYYLKDYPYIFACHFGRGSTLGEAKYSKGTNFLFRLPLLGKFFRLKKGKKEKQKWLKICKKIIDGNIL